MRRANAFSAECEYVETDPDGYRSGSANVGKAVGGEALAVKVFELPAGQSVCPYHYEYEEEWLLVLDGTVVVRTPEGEQSLGRGELICFAPGPTGAHKATNRSERTARVLMFSSARQPAVAVYPDSDKLGVWTGNADDDVMLRRGGRRRLLGRRALGKPQQAAPRSDLQRNAVALVAITVAEQAPPGDGPRLVPGGHVHDTGSRRSSQLAGLDLALAVRAAQLDAHLMPALAVGDAHRPAGVRPHPAIAPLHQRE
jgi:uncharacterized cupin superfamily protein